METKETKHLEAVVSEIIDEGKLIMLPWGTDGRLVPELLIDYLEDVLGVRITLVKSLYIRDMVEKKYNLVYESSEMVSLLIVSEGQGGINESRLMPKPLLYGWIDDQVNRWRRRRGYVDKVNGIDMLRELITEDYGSDIQAGSLDEIKVMLFYLSCLGDKNVRVG